jgi:hypothetical protein
MHQTKSLLLRNDVTTTENISAPIPLLNPFASMCAPQDEDNAVFCCPTITCGWDPGRPNESPLLLIHLTHSTILRNATTTGNINAPIPLLNPFASMRAPQDEDNAALGRLSITCGCDPGRPNEPPLLLLNQTHPELLRNDTMSTEPTIVPLPLLNPFDSMRALQDEDNDAALDCSSIVTCGWDPGKDDTEASLSDCETVLACVVTTGAPSSTISLSQAGSAGMDCRRRRPRQRRPPGTSTKKALRTTTTQSLMTTMPQTRESPNLSTVLLVY